MSDNTARFLGQIVGGALFIYLLLKFFSLIPRFRGFDNRFEDLGLKGNQIAPPAQLTPVRVNNAFFK